MSRVPSFGLLEVLILAGGAGLVLLIGAIIVAVIVKKRRQSSVQLDDSGTNGNDESEWRAASTRARRAPRWWKWIVVLVLIVLALPLLVVVFGVLLVMPVRQVTEPVTAPQPVVVFSSAPTPTGAPESMPTPSAVSTITPRPLQTSTSSAYSGFLDPDKRLTWLVVLPGIAGLVLLVGAVVILLVGMNWQQRGSHPRDASTNRENGTKWPRWRVVLLVLLSWIALSVFLVLDLGFSVSLYLRFVAIYAAFWVLVGALLLSGRPLREKVIILALFVGILYAARFVDWTSRKPFLRDLYRIREGMTPAQVDRIMNSYMRENGGGPPGSQSQPEFDERGEIVQGWVTFRHTNEGWGDSDWGLVAFIDGRVSEIRFLPD